MHGDFTFEGNRLCRHWAEASDTYAFLDQLHNSANPQAYFNHLGPEIVGDLPDVTAVVGSMGSGGTMCGLNRFFKAKKLKTRIFTVQSCSGTRIPGIGTFEDGDYKTPFINEISSNNDDPNALMISIGEAVAFTEELAKQGIFVGYQGGGVLAATIQAIKNFNLQGDIVTILGDSGWKNMEKFKKP
jgi:cysteine synthase